MNVSRPDYFSLANKVCVVTGAASGIGRETLLVLGRSGAHVVGLDRNIDTLEETRALADNEGLSVEFYAADVADREAIMSIADQVLKKNGRVDGWANVAGILRYAFIADITPEHVNELIAVNQLGVLWGLAAAAKVMKSGGSIVSVASAGGEMPFPRLGGYGMTKAAVIQLTRTASVEFGELGIRVNAIAPGYVETPMVAASYSRADGTIDEALKAQFFDARRSQSPLSITGEPLDIALTVLYLMSDASKFMTGQVLRPNGGVYFG